MELPLTGPREPAHRGIDLLPQRAGRPDHRRSPDGASGHAVVLGVVVPSEARRFADLAGAHRTLVITRKGGKVVTIPLAPRTARAIDLAVGERVDGPIFCGLDGSGWTGTARGASSAG